MAVTHVVLDSGAVSALAQAERAFALALGQISVEELTRTAQTAGGFQLKC